MMKRGDAAAAAGYGLGLLGRSERAGSPLRKQRLRTAVFDRKGAPCRRPKRDWLPSTGLAPPVRLGTHNLAITSRMRSKHSHRRAQAACRLGDVERAHDKQKVVTILCGAGLAQRFKVHIVNQGNAPEHQ